MDTDLIDSCREFNGETGNADDLCLPNDNVQNINNKALSEPSGSQRSSNEDPRRLRRWLTEMENRFSKSPTFTEAMKLNSVELQKTLSEYEVSVFVIVIIYYCFIYLFTFANSLIYHTFEHRNVCLCSLNSCFLFDHLTLRGKHVVHNLTFNVLDIKIE